MSKFDFEYVYAYSALRYHKIIEAESIYDAYIKFYKETMEDKSILVCSVKGVK